MGVVSVLNQRIKFGFRAQGGAARELFWCIGLSWHQNAATSIVPLKAKSGLPSWRVHIEASLSLDPGALVQAQLETATGHAKCHGMTEGICVSLRSSIGPLDRIIRTWRQSSTSLRLLFGLDRLRFDHAAPAREFRLDMPFEFVGCGAARLET